MFCEECKRFETDSEGVHGCDAPCPVWVYSSQVRQTLFPGLDAGSCKFFKPKEGVNKTEYTKERGEAAIEKIFAELRKAEAKHPGWPSDPVHAAAILSEEAGETVQAAIDYYYGRGDKEKMLHEAAQTGAMAIRLLLGAGNYLDKKGGGA